MRFSKAGVTLLKGQILLWQFQHVLSSKTSKSGGAMACYAQVEVSTSCHNKTKKDV